MNNELTAVLLTIEKCRELSGCPAGVELQDWVKQLTAENLGLKASIPPLKMINDVTDSWDDVSLAEDVGFNLAISAIMKNIPDTPATDRIVAGIKADAANQMCVAFVKHKELAGLSDDDVVTVREATDAVLHCAEVISEGADK
ncbi:TPA: hypothetical protein OMU28_003042 [Klebsiella aerogenes]|nr:hypothetical protein [Klebsiella aerogenes]